MNQNNGGPAFPTFEMVEQYSDAKQQYVTRPHALSGMSLRDYFAAQGLTALLWKGHWSHGEGEFPYATDLALMAYVIADAMLAEREKPA